MYAQFHKVLAWTLDIFFPPRCAICERISPEAAASFLCGACAAAIPLHDSLFCGACGARIPLPLAKTRRGETKFFAECHPKTPFLLAAAARYARPAVRRLIWQLKYRHTPALAKPLGMLLVRYHHSITRGHTKHSNILENVGMFCVVVPIPLAAPRLRERGYNHAEEIAREFASALHLPLVSALHKIKHTKPQAEMKEWDDRAKNVAGCFAAANPAAIEKKTVLLVDDVTTSGATLAEAAKTLKRAGAKAVIALVAAKA